MNAYKDVLLNHQIEILSTKTLAPYARNSRTHDDDQILQIADSIRDFGFTNPVLIDSDNGIIAAHSHDFIGEQTRLKAKLGAIGYHPSLLPLHRGRDAIYWTIKMGDKVAGGSVYQLSNKTDAGRILSQEHVFVRPGDSVETLWRRDLAPLGVKLLTGVVKRFAAGGVIVGKQQDETLATWEPSYYAPPLYKPDLIMLPSLSC